MTVVDVGLRLTVAMDKLWDEVAGCRAGTETGPMI